MNTTSSFLLLFLFFSFFCSLSVSDSRAKEGVKVCTNRTAAVPDRQTFINTFLSSLDALTPQISSQRFAKTINTNGNITVYAFGECMKDLSKTDCDQCFAQCKLQIVGCLPFQRAVRGGRYYFDGCYLRYDDYEFFQEAFSPGDTSVCSKRDFNGNSTAYRANAMELVRNLSVEASKNDGFSVGFVKRGNLTVYGLAQCWKFVNTSSCRICLENATLAIGSCLPKDEGRVLNAGCYLRYSPEKFYFNSTINNNGSRGGGHLAVILAVVSSVSAAIIILAAGAFFAWRKVSKKKKEKKQLGTLGTTLRKSHLYLAYEVLEKATNYFNYVNKLGQGGSGTVYKGILPGGKVIAVKRLVFTTTDWVEHFYNEVNLISDVNHKNLVKLLGCSITGPESLLVYEYIPNQSIQNHLFSKDKSRLLSWEVRNNIITGTAEGLVYLHEESKLTIIHRDIKLTNVLLDENFMPKIADFGLARLFPEDITHLSTGIAGTLGYMAPEYVVHGKLSVKADVYSFGVLVIEVVSGRRNHSLNRFSVSILHTVWNHYVSGNLYEAVDARLDGCFQNEEVSRVLQIGLLCTQASAELRPSMSMVVKMLTGDHDIPQPTQPPFLNTSSS